jgi:hypothetical protein
MGATFTIGSMGAMGATFTMGATFMGATFTIKGDRYGGYDVTVGPSSPTLPSTRSMGATAWVPLITTSQLRGSHAWVPRSHLLICHQASNKCVIVNVAPFIGPSHFTMRATTFA